MQKKNKRYSQVKEAKRLPFFMFTCVKGRIRLGCNYMFFFLKIFLKKFFLIVPVSKECIMAY